MESGVYQVQFRGLTMAECWRFGGPAGFPIALVLKAINKEGGCQWLPSHESEAVCEESELSAEAHTALNALGDDLQRLGYGSKKCFIKNRYMLDETIADAGALLTLHTEGKKSLFIASVRARFGNSPRHVLSISGTLFFADNTSYAVCTEKNYFDDSRTEVAFLSGGNVSNVDRLLTERLAKDGHCTQRFSTLDALRDYNHRRETEIWDERIARGLLRKVSPEEQARVLLKMTREL